MSPVSDDDIAAIVDGVPIPENSNCTQALIGATFVSASSLHFEGKATLLFAFPVGVMMHRCLRTSSSLIFSFMQDLACNLDGTFLLRYRAMNLFGAALEADRDRLPIIAECWGGPAIVYPTKDFPGLTESTDLTKVSVSIEAMLVIVLRDLAPAQYLSRFGVPVNIRQGERKKRARRDSLEEGPSTR